MIQNYTQKPTCLVRLCQCAEITRDTVIKLYTLYDDTVVDLTIGKVVGNYAALGPIEIYQYETDPNQGGGPQSQGDHPVNGILLSISPNPLTDEGIIEYALTHSTTVHLALYDAAGRLVKVLANGYMKTGIYRHSIKLHELSQGIYFLCLTTDAGSEARKLIYLE